MAFIYFSGSISGGREDVEIYNSIVDALRQLGHDVNAGQVTNREILASGEPGGAREIFDRDIAWLDAVADRSGVLVAEVSRPSTGVGYEIGYARYERGMPVICLWRPAHGTRCSAMVAGDPDIDVIQYDERDLAGLVSRLHEKIAELSE